MILLIRTSLIIFYRLEHRLIMHKLRKVIELYVKVRKNPPIPYSYSFVKPDTFCVSRSLINSVPFLFRSFGHTEIDKLIRLILCVIRIRDSKEVMGVCIDDFTLKLEFFGLEDDAPEEFVTIFIEFPRTRVHIGEYKVLGPLFRFQLGLRVYKQLIPILKSRRGFYLHSFTLKSVPLSLRSDAK